MGWVRVIALFLFFSSLAYAGARTDADEQLIARVCQSTAPVLVVDNFAGDKTSGQPDVDLNGDGTYDVLHGDFVAKIIEYDGHQVVKAQTPVVVVDLLAILQPYLNKIKSGELKISRINFSQGFVVTFDMINQVLGLPIDTVNYNNVYEKRAQVLPALAATYPSFHLMELAHAFQELEKLGVPVFAAAGNSTFREVNVYSLLPDVHTVGALNLKGEKASYSADNSTVTIWRRGGILTYSVDGGTGIALGNHEKSDFILSTPQVPQSLLSEFNGKDPSTVARQIPDKIEAANNDDASTFFDLAAKLPKGLYNTSDVEDHSLATNPDQAHYIKKYLGDYFYMDGVHPLPLVYLHNDPFSNLLLIQQGVQTPDGRQYRNVNYGTSFAAPSICDGERTPEQYAL